MEAKAATGKASGREHERTSLSAPELFTASDVARFCQVDLKTIHNWADKGEIPHFRTPGRHLRFRRLDVLDFLRRYGYAIPEPLRLGKPRVAVLDPDPATVASARRALGKRFEVVAFAEPFEALVLLGEVQPDVLVLDLDLPGVDPLLFLSRLRALAATAHIRVVVFSSQGQLRAQALSAGAVDFVDKGDPNRLRETLEQLMGLER